MPDGRKFDGIMKAGKMFNGTLTFPDKACYTGEFKNGSMEGKAVMKYPDGKVYEGQSVDGNPNGQGKMTDKKGKVQQGMWKDGMYMKTGK